MTVWRILLMSGVALAAGCARTSAPPRFASSPAATRPAPVPVTPTKPAWVARKVVADGIELTPGIATAGDGETLAQVAARTRIPLGALIATNGFADARAAAAPGQSLKLPGGRVHTVHPGESGISIARAYGVEWSRVVSANRLHAPYVIEVGDRLLLPSKQAVAAMTIEQRAAAFRIDIDDLITGAEPAAPKAKVAAATSALLKPLPAVTGPAPRFDWPLDGRVLASFGAKPGGRFNDGLDLKASAGDPVRAAADGVVAYAGNALAGFGNLILVKHADGWVSAYGHNAAMLVARGARVARGQIIARAGATGAVSEPQLHFELRRGRLAMDPQKLLPARG